MHGYEYSSLGLSWVFDVLPSGRNTFPSSSEEQTKPNLNISSTEKDHRDSRGRDQMDGALLVFFINPTLQRRCPGISETFPIHESLLLEQEKISNLRPAGVQRETLDSRGLNPSIGMEGLRRGKRGAHAAGIEGCHRGKRGFWFFAPPAPLFVLIRS